MIPSWDPDGKVKNAARTINARAETITTSKVGKASQFYIVKLQIQFSLFEHQLWRGIVPRHRCLVVANGYFEWDSKRGKKVPYYIHHKDEGTLITFAGLYDVWTDPKTGAKTFSYSIVRSVFFCLFRTHAFDRSQLTPTRRWASFTLACRLYWRPRKRGSCG